MNHLGSFWPLIVMALIFAQQLRRVKGSAKRRRLEAAAAAAPRTAAPAQRPPQAPPPATGVRRTTQPVGRLPVRVDAAPATPVAPPPAPPLLDRSAGPRWAANAVIAAEVFGPPVAVRPGGTLGPPHAL
jgi:hypothetical protein